MDNDDDDDDLRSLSQRLLPLASTSLINNTSNSSKNKPTNRTRSLKSQSIDNQISLPLKANTGDIIQLHDGTRKKYNGSSWRRMCSKPNCTHYTQSQGLCKPHLAAFKKHKHTQEKNDIEPKKGNIIALSNGIRKKFDGRQYRRVCAEPNCTIVVHGSLEYQKGYIDIIHLISLKILI